MEFLIDIMKKERKTLAETIGVTSRKLGAPCGGGFMFMLKGRVSLKKMVWGNYARNQNILFDYFQDQIKELKKHQKKVEAMNYSLEFNLCEQSGQCAVILNRRCPCCGNQR